MKRRAALMMSLALFATACGTEVENATSQLIEQVRLGDPLATQTYNDNAELLESEEAFPIWLNALQNDESPAVKAYAAQMLGNQRNPEALPALAAAMGDTREVRDAAISGIRQFDDEDASRAFVMVLESDSRDAKAVALAQLSRVGTADAVQAVKAVAASGDPLLSETAANTLGDMGTPEAAVALGDLATDTSLEADVRMSAIVNLGRIEGVDDQIERVTAALADEEGADALRARAESLQ